MPLSMPEYSGLSFLKVYFMRLLVLSACLSMCTCVCLWKRVLNRLNCGWLLQVMWVPGIEPGSFARTISVPKCRAIPVGIILTALMEARKPVHCGQHHSLAGILDPVSDKGAEQRKRSSPSFLSWQCEHPASSACQPDSPPWWAGPLNCEPKRNPFPIQLLLSVF